MAPAWVAGDGGGEAAGAPGGISEGTCDVISNALTPGAAPAGAGFDPGHPWAPAQRPRTRPRATRLPCYSLDRSPIQPILCSKMDVDCPAREEQIGMTTTREILLNIEPERTIFRSILHNKDDQKRLLEPEEQIATVDRP